MKKLFHRLLLLTFPAIAAGVVSCSLINADSSNDTAVTEFDFRQSLVLGEKLYRVVTDNDTVYLSLFVNVEWPVKLAHYDIKVLQDTIMEKAFGITRIPVRVAASRFVNDVKGVADVKFFEPVDSIPEESVTWFNNVSVQGLTLRTNYTTYVVSTESYLGGAHPISSDAPFTYDFTSSRILDFASIFRPGVSESDIIPLLKKALCEKYNVSEEGLENEGFFMSKFDSVGQPYFDEGQLWFHFDPYEIAPYSTGSIDICLNIDDISAYLRPEILKMLDDGI